jgi:hypothetical protein
VVLTPVELLRDREMETVSAPQCQKYVGLSSNLLKRHYETLDSSPTTTDLETSRQLIARGVDFSIECRSQLGGDPN